MSFIEQLRNDRARIAREREAVKEDTETLRMDTLHQLSDLITQGVVERWAELTVETSKSGIVTDNARGNTSVLFSYKPCMEEGQRPRWRVLTDPAGLPQLARLNGEVVRASSLVTLAVALRREGLKAELGYFKRNDRTRDAHVLHDWQSLEDGVVPAAYAERDGLYISVERTSGLFLSVSWE